MAAPTQSRILKFGVFEADLEAGELRKSGMRLKLAAQSFRVLQLLLEHPQEIVTREDLRRRIWPSDTFVDYDLALRKAVTRLREVLGDSAESPRFIETIPRRGYRFIAPPEYKRRCSRTHRGDNRSGLTATRSATTRHTHWDRNWAWIGDGLADLDGLCLR